ncbi:MAG: hypothetical protein NUV51_03745 [Sulfuricaulis sp.]|nr:hypothetical protein [Sulfuricaulis sp.]
MKVCFLGTSHAAQHLSRAAVEKGFELVELNENPSLVFVSEDTPTNANGVRDLDVIRSFFFKAKSGLPVPLILTSQVPPGFTRSLRIPGLYHQAETLRIKDAEERARHPEMMIVGCADPAAPLPLAYSAYLRAFDCPILTMSYESAEFAKCAINAFLISQVETTNMLARLAEKCGAQWGDVTRALHLDSRIGMQAYLTPGCWQDSRHLLRDYVTLLGLHGPSQNYESYPANLIEALDMK